MDCPVEIGKLLVLNGPNLNLLGIREPEIYGKGSYAQLEEWIAQQAKSCGLWVKIVQSNQEGQLVDWIQWAYGRMDGVILNPAAYTHTSIALLDALRGVGLPAVEVHLSDPSQREEFRRRSYVALACEASFVGLGWEGYGQALRYFQRKFSE